MHLTHLVLPVKFTPARSGCWLMTLPNWGPSQGTKLMTPAGTPASLKILAAKRRNRYQFQEEKTKYKWTLKFYRRSHLQPFPRLNRFLQNKMNDRSDTLNGQSCSIWPAEWQKSTFFKTAITVFLQCPFVLRINCRASRFESFSANTI